MVGDASVDGAPTIADAHVGNAAESGSPAEETKVDTIDSQASFSALPAMCNVPNSLSDFRSLGSSSSSVDLAVLPIISCFSPYVNDHNTAATWRGETDAELKSVAALDRMAVAVE